MAKLNNRLERLEKLAGTANEKKSRGWPVFIDRIEYESNEEYDKAIEEALAAGAFVVTVARAEDRPNNDTVH